MNVEVWLIKLIYILVGVIHFVSRSGKEGFYPHLITFCESHLERLNPKSRALWRENPAATAASLSKDEWSQIVSEMKVWFIIYVLIPS